MSLESRLIALLKANADASGDNLEKVQLGTPGSSIMYPSAGVGDELVADATELGQMWSTVFLPALLEGLGDLLDKFKITWAKILTNNTGVAPTISSHFNAVSAAKNEGTGEVTLTIDEDYSAASAYIALAHFGPTVAAPLLAAQAVGSVTFKAYTLAGAVDSINDKAVSILCVGAG